MTNVHTIYPLTVSSCTTRQCCFIFLLRHLKHPSLVRNEATLVDEHHAVYTEIVNRHSRNPGLILYRPPPPRLSDFVYLRFLECAFVHSESQYLALGHSVTWSSPDEPEWNAVCLRLPHGSPSSMVCVFCRCPSRELLPFVAPPLSACTVLVCLHFLGHRRHIAGRISQGSEWSFG